MSTTYSANPAIGAPGQVYDTGADNIVVTKIATTVIPFGCFVSFHDGDGICHVPNAVGEVPGANGGGIALIDEQLPSGEGGYPVGSAVRVLIKGRVFVSNEEALAHTDAVFVRYAAGGTGLGYIGNDAGTSERAALTRATVFQGGSTGLAVLSLS